jgi:hypothetical protein
MSRGVPLFGTSMNPVTCTHSLPATYQLHSFKLHPDSYSQAPDHCWYCVGPKMVNMLNVGS